MNKEHNNNINDQQKMIDEVTSPEHLHNFDIHHDELVMQEAEVSLIRRFGENARNYQDDTLAGELIELYVVLFLMKHHNLTEIKKSIVGRIRSYKLEKFKTGNYRLIQKSTNIHIEDLDGLLFDEKKKVIYFIEVKMVEKQGAFGQCFRLDTQVVIEEAFKQFELDGYSYTFIAYLSKKKNIADALKDPSFHQRNYTVEFKNLPYDRAYLLQRIQEMKKRL